MKHHRKHKPFITLPRHKRGDAVFRLRKKIATTAHSYGPMFTSDLMMDEPGRPAAYKQWFDAYFPGSDKFTLWNCTISTANHAFWEKVEEMARLQVEAKLSGEELNSIFQHRWKPVAWGDTGKATLFELEFEDSPAFEQLSGLTYEEACKDAEWEIVKNDPPVVFEEFSLDQSYAYGIGLSMIVDEPVIDRQTIEKSIVRFMNGKEKPWKSSIPVSRDSLPVVPSAIAYAAAEKEFSEFRSKASNSEVLEG